jgi:hypothetical protein
MYSYGLGTLVTHKRPRILFYFSSNFFSSLLDIEEVVMQENGPLVIKCPYTTFSYNTPELLVVRMESVLSTDATARWCQCHGNQFPNLKAKPEVM